MKYERLTKKAGWHKDIDLTQELGYSYIYQRLSELENKIEDGTLVEVLCTAGDKVYQFDNGGKIYESEIKSIYYANNTLFCDCGYFAFDKRAIGKTVFLTKAEAEMKLKELQGK